MENTFMSHELEEMRVQINILKDKLERQTIVNENHIRNSMKSKANDLRKTIRGTVGCGIFAILYCPICFYYLGCSLPFVIVTTVMLAICLALTIRQNVVLGRKAILSKQPRHWAVSGNIISNGQDWLLRRLSYRCMRGVCMNSSCWINRAGLS